MFKGFKKVWAVICLSALIFSMCACGASDVESESNDEPEVTEDVAEDDEEEDEEEGLGDLIEEEDDEEEGLGDQFTDEDLYAALYIEQIEALLDAGDADQFAFYDINADETPELIAVSSEGSWDKDQIFLYTFYDDEIVLLLTDVAPGIEGHYVAISGEKNIIECSGAALGERHDFYEIADGELNNILSIQYYDNLDTEDDPDDILYFVDEEETDEEGYIKAEEKIANDMGAMIMLNADEMTVMSQSYENGYREFTEEDHIPYMSYEEIME